MLGVHRYLPALLILLKPASLQQTQGVALTGKIMRAGAPGSVALQLSLRNSAAVTLTVLTGVYADQPYPAANFDFVIRLPDQRRVRLDCWSCGPTVVGGALGVYKIVLWPRQSAVVVARVPLSALAFASDAEHRLCTTKAGRGDLTVSLHGRQWPSGNPDIRETYWTGDASVTIPVTCDAKGQ
jgi:hypothetical protein